VNADRGENDLAGDHGDHKDDRGVNASTQRRPMPLCRVSEAVNPANNATFPIGSIVVQMVAKSLLILIRSGDSPCQCGRSAWLRSINIF